MTEQSQDAKKCPLILKSDKVYFASSLIAKPSIEQKLWSDQNRHQTTSFSVIGCQLAVFVLMVQSKLNLKKFHPSISRAELSQKVNVSRIPNIHTDYAPYPPVDLHLFFEIFIRTEKRFQLELKKKISQFILKFFFSSH